MNRYDFSRNRITPREYFLVCLKCGYSHSNLLKRCPLPTQTSHNLKNGVGRNLEVVPADEWERMGRSWDGKRDFKLRHVWEKMANFSHRYIAWLRTWI